MSALKGSIVHRIHKWYTAEIGQPQGSSLSVNEGSQGCRLPQGREATLSRWQGWLGSPKWTRQFSSPDLSLALAQASDTFHAVQHIGVELDTLHRPLEQEPEEFAAHRLLRQHLPVGLAGATGVSGWVSGGFCGLRPTFVPFTCVRLVVLRGRDFSMMPASAHRARNKEIILTRCLLGSKALNASAMAMPPSAAGSTISKTWMYAARTTSAGYSSVLTLEALDDLAGSSPVQQLQELEALECAVPWAAATPVASSALACHRYWQSPVAVLLDGTGHGGTGTVGGGVLDPIGTPGSHFAMAQTVAQIGRCPDGTRQSAP